MTYFVHISDTCIKEAKAHHHEEEVKKLAHKLEEKQTIDNLDSYGAYFVKKDFGRSYRLVIRKVYDGEDCLLVFWRFLPKSHRDYTDFYKNYDHYIQTFDAEFSKENLTSIWEEKRRHQQQITFIPDLTDKEKEFLYQELTFTKENNDWMILESDDWWRRTGSKSNSTPLTTNTKDFSSYRSELHTLLLKAIEDGEDFYTSNDKVGILYQRFPKNKILFLIAPVFPKDEQDQNKLTQKYENFLNGEAEETKLARFARRSYPSIVVYDDKLWLEIQEEDDKANLALSQEEVAILKQQVGFYPLFINGRPGSGKSTVLQYLFAEYLYNYFPQQGEIAPPVYLTYSPELLDVAKRVVSKLLTINASKAILKERLNPVQAQQLTNQTFFVFRDYLKQILPPTDLFLPERYVNFPRFRAFYEDKFSKHPDKALRSMAEIAWHVIRTYIKGSVSETDEYMDPDDFQAFPSKKKSVTQQTFEIVHEMIWDKWYKSLAEEKGYWDDQDLARTVLNAMWEDQLSPSFKGNSVIFCDEAQDFTRNELRLIFRLSVFSRRKLYPDTLNKIPFAFAGDPFQTLNPTGFDWDSTSENLYRTIRDQIDQRQNPSLEINYKELQFNYRSRKSIVQLCNFIHLLRGLAFEKKGLKPQMAWYDDPSDMPTFFDVKSPSVKTYLPKQEENVIIVPCQEGEELTYVQNDPILSEFALNEDETGLTRNILSPMRAKGQEFDRVVLYCFGDACIKDEQYKQLLNLITNPAEKQIMSSEEMIPLEYFINRLYVGASRAKKRILIVDTQEGLQGFWRIFSDCDLEDFTTRYRNLTRKDEWDSSRHLVRIQPGKSQDWEKDSNLPAELAEQFMQAGKQKQDAYLMQRPAQNWRLDKQEDKAIECDALACEYRKDFTHAGQFYQQLGNIEKAEDCFWKAKAFKQIAELKSNTIFCKAANYMTDTKRLTFEETRQLLDEVVESLSKDSSKLDEIWGEVLVKLYQGLLEKSEENALKGYEWQKYYDQVVDFRKKGVLPNSTADDLEYLSVRAKPYPEKLEELQRIGVDPEKIIALYIENKSKDIKKQAIVDIILQALKQKNRLDDIEELVRKYPSLERFVSQLAAYLKEDEREKLEGIVLEIFIFLTKQKMWDTAITFVKYKRLPHAESISESLQKRNWEYLLDRQFIKALAQSQELVEAEQHILRDVSDYLKERLLEMSSAFYNDLTVAQAGAALERANKIMDCLEFYEMVWQKQTWPAVEEDIHLARQRWLVCKKRQAENLAQSDDEKKRIWREIERRKSSWQIESLDNLPDFPEVDLTARPKPVRITPRTSAPSQKSAEDEKKGLPVLQETPKAIPGLPSLNAMIKPDDLSFKKPNHAEEPLMTQSIPEYLSKSDTNQIAYKVSVADVLFEIELNRQSGKMTIRKKGGMEQITATAKNMKLDGSDEDFRGQIEERSRRNDQVRYFIRPWNLTCILRVRNRNLYADLYFGEKEAELLSVKLNS